ncbi:FecR family protein [Pseudomonas sp. PDM14]|uniref:FecR domain-containing protein n=1 Tax=Pseudomonas sp. PDM14 TaxID=2769288 RepID=UPI001786B971|nr:FecR family protein [Pseudomonas sp. PDM14]MBD9482915.1 FecR family protein [Pseudomonas sp. PDM14]
MSAVSARVLDEAIAWQLCLGSGDASSQDQQSFAGWLAAHPDHARVWQQLSCLDQQLAGASATPARRALVRSSQNRRRLGSTLGTVLLCGLALGLAALHRPLGDYLADETTGSGEIRSLILADRTRLDLNSLSALDIDFDGSERRLFLRSGEVLIETGHDDPRPFVVETAQGRLRALGTRFLVRREGEATRLIVLQSAVAARPSSVPDERIVAAGEQVLMSATHLGASEAAPLSADAWSRGMLVVENQRLGDLLDQLGEYRTGYLGVDPSIADLRISGSFPLRDSDLALAALPPSLPVAIERHTDWWVRVVPRSATQEKSAGEK